jgi:hypothetical protein
MESVCHSELIVCRRDLIIFRLCSGVGQKYSLVRLSSNLSTMLN